MPERFVFKRQAATTLVVAPQRAPAKVIIRRLARKVLKTVGRANFIPRLCSETRLAAPASDEMNDFDLISVTQHRLSPACAAHDFAVEFDGEAFGRERELADECVERERLRQFADFPVDLDAQDFPFQGWWMTRRSSAVKPSRVARTSTAARPFVKRGSHA